MREVLPFIDLGIVPYFKYNVLYWRVTRENL